MFGFGDEEEKEKDLATLQQEATKGPGGLALAFKGLAGLGDAITGAYGTGKTDFMGSTQDIMNQAQKRKELAYALAEKKKKEGEAMALKQSENKDKSEYLKGLLGLKKSQQDSSAADKKEERDYRAKMLALEEKKARDLDEYRDKYLAGKDGGLGGGLGGSVASGGTPVGKLKRDKLPMSSQKMIDNLSAKLANLQTLRNTTGEELVNFKGAQDDDERAVIGNNMLKGLNSISVGQPDVVGEGEAKRLSPFLENKKFNMFGPGSMFGRDLDKFAGQAQGKLDAADRAMADLAAQIDHLERGGDLSTYKPKLAEGGQKKVGGGMINEAQAGEMSPPVRRKTADGRVALFDPKTKQFIKYED